MDLKECFPSSLSCWVRYQNYQIINVPEGRRIVPKKGAKFAVYNPLESAIDMLLDVLNFGKQSSMSIADAEKGLLDITRKYGLLGIFSDILLNEDFYRYPLADVFVATNPFIKADGYDRYRYLSMFFQDGFDFESVLEQQPVEGRDSLYNAVFSPQYGEYTYWLATYCSDLFQYFKYSSYTEDQELRQNYMEIYNRDHFQKLRYVVVDDLRPTIQWIFPSLKSVIDMALAQCMIMEENPLKTCKHCEKIYYNENNRSEFCSPRCRNQWNVYKSRSKK